MRSVNSSGNTRQTQGVRCSAATAENHYWRGEQCRLENADRKNFLSFLDLRSTGQSTSHYCQDTSKPQALVGSDNECQSWIVQHPSETFLVQGPQGAAPPSLLYLAIQGPRLLPSCSFTCSSAVGASPLTWQMGKQGGKLHDRVLHHFLWGEYTSFFPRCTGVVV